MKKLAAVLAALTVFLLGQPPAFAFYNASPVDPGWIYVEYCGGGYASVGVGSFITEQDLLVSWTTLVRRLIDGTGGYSRLTMFVYHRSGPLEGLSAPYAQAVKNAPDQSHCGSVSPTTGPWVPKSVLASTSTEATDEAGTHWVVHWAYCGGTQQYLDYYRTSSEPYEVTYVYDFYTTALIRQYQGTSGVADLYIEGEDGVAVAATPNSQGHWNGAYSNVSEIHSAAHPACVVGA